MLTADSICADCEREEYGVRLEADRADVREVSALIFF